MSIISDVFGWIVRQISKLLPSLPIPRQISDALGGAMDTLVSFLNFVGYIFPLNTLVICLISYWAFDIAVLGFRMVQFVLKLVRG